MITILWIAAAVMGGLGVLLVLMLILANRVFLVQPNPLEAKVRSVLPGANCGGCSYPGCDAYAAAVARGDAPPDACPVGGASVAEKIGKIMGVEVEGGEPRVAFLLCQGGSDIVAQSADYKGIPTCRAANLVGGGTKACAYGCLGFGDCTTVCPFDAIHMGPKGLPVVDREKCTACGICVKTCPKSVLRLVPLSKQVFLACNSADKGKAVRDVCKIGCHACSICVKMCPYGALEMVNNLPVMNLEKCVDCGICYQKCPTKSAYVDFAAPRPKTEIDVAKCKGHHKCFEVCKFKAIEGEAGAIHKVVEANCVGCEECIKACPTKACFVPSKAGAKAVV